MASPRPPWRRVLVVVVPVASGLALVGVQVGPMFALTAPDFGVFSLAYLLFALGTSLTLSIVCEASLTARGHSGAAGPRSWDTPWTRYGSVLTAISAIVALGVLAIIAALRGPLDSLLASSAAFTAVLWQGARYYELGGGRLGRVVVGDALAGGVAITAWVLVTVTGGGDLSTALLIWLVSGLVAVAAVRRWPAWNLGALRPWIDERRHSIRHLLRDSAVMDASAVGTPLVLAPLLGTAGFGVYRGVSNLAAPVRLLLNPVRPLIATWSQTVPSSRLAAFFALLGALSGSLGYVTLRAVSPHLSAGTVLGEVAGLAAPTALFMAANMAGHAAYIVVRSRPPSAAILVPRLWQTGMGVAGPFIGLLLGGLEGAVWGFAVASTISALHWLHFMSRHQV
ncbi:hypothetical protein ACQE98_00310 [Ornithinimicrobium sp. W1679]|uniref:hypothetical protein n=1 Tax=Ornithinimicrobium sp. W1679 TaxID=3418770 RepID=UPI003CED9244